MEQPFEEVAAPLVENAWNDDALLDAFERAVSTHGMDKKGKQKQTKEGSSKGKTTVIFKRNAEQNQEEESDDNMDAVIAQSTTQSATENKKQKTTSEKPTSNKQEQYIPQQSTQQQQQQYYQQQIPQQIPQQQFTQPQPSLIPSLPDMEEQEALSQLLLAWYQAGYAAGRYASIRQRKCCCVCSTNNPHTLIYIKQLFLG